MSEANKNVCNVLKNKLINRKNGSLIFVITVLMSSPSYAVTAHQKDIYRLYAHTQIVNYSEFQCFDTLIMRESNYNPRAVNGSHYGLVQGGSKWLKDKDAFTQIDWGIKYVHNRYAGSWCKALSHSNRRGWY